MTRVGKIARLPSAVRSQLNTRLEEGLQAASILQWLNSLPEVRSVLTESFHGRPVSPQNLSEWRNGGYQEWLARKDLFGHISELAADQDELQVAARSASVAEFLSKTVAYRLALILSRSSIAPDLHSSAQIRALLPLVQTVVNLRRGDCNAARLNLGSRRRQPAHHQNQPAPDPTFRPPQT